VNANAEELRAARLEAIRRSEAGSADADSAWRRVLALAPGDPEAHYALGRGAGDRGEFAAAAMHFRTALALAPRHPQLRASLALALEEQGELGESESLWRALAGETRGDAMQAKVQLARNLVLQRRYAEAQALFDAADRRGALGHPLMLAAYAACLAHAGKADAADAAFRRALSFGDAAGVGREYAAFLMRHKRYADAASVLSAAAAATGDDLLAASMLIACRLHLADWRDYAALRARVVGGVAANAGRRTDIVPAFDFISVCDDRSLQLAAARGWSASEVKGVAPLGSPSRKAPRRIRLGFVSSDFGNHPVGRLAVALIERLDRARFEVLAYVTTPEVQDAFRRRAEQAADRFTELDRRDAAKSATALARDEIDVLFDLNGYSGGEAIRIFAHRPAPLQVNFLGYTGTLGSPHYDAIVCDSYCLPAAAEAAYTERPLRVDPCYLPSDPLRTSDGILPMRSHYDLPEGRIVFCAFAAVAKIVPDMFDAWMQILRDVPDSVLWLRHMADDRIGRLRAEATRRGVEAQRLIFAPADPVPRYLARFALADVFLDSAPFGSHTTVNDALFMHVPVVTLAGESFAARASASQLVALGLGELVAGDPAEYVAIAGRIAASPSYRSTLVARLGDAGNRAALFDMDAYARRFETAIIGEIERRAASR
jgi:predicted O-linked N-acetylglucosamine transferase (SPINDLY family)